MTTLGRDFVRDEAGLILSAELIVILTITVLGMVVGLVNLQQAVLGEFADLSLAFQSLNQSYSTPSFRGCWKFWGRTSWTAGSSFIDVFDGCVGSGPMMNYTGGEIVGSSSYYLPSQNNQVIGTPQSTTAPNVVCPPETQILQSPAVSPPQFPSTVPCSTCP